MRIDLDSVLWRTRGRTWDYRFVLRPVHPHIETWYDFHADAFSGVTPGRDPINVGGVLHTSGRTEVPFVATTFQDPTLRDAAGRPVVHYLVWFPTVSGVSAYLEVPEDWGLQFVQAFGDEWKTAFSSDGASDDDLLEPARSRLKEVSLSDARNASIQLDRQIYERELRDRVEKKKRRAVPPRSRTHRTLLLLAIGAAALILAVLISWLTNREAPYPTSPGIPITPKS